MNNLFLKDKLASNAMEILWLPITSNADENYCDILENRLDSYYAVLVDNINSIYEDLNKDTQSYNKKEVLDWTHFLISGIKDCHKFYLCGSILQAQNALFSALDRIYAILKECCSKLESPHKYWRIRKGKSSSIYLSDLYHIPFNQIYLCKDDRFNTKGYPCLYLSWEERGCIQEMNYSPKEDTLASFLYDKDYELQVIDLTIVNNAEYNTDKANIIGHIIWPLLAACYGISEYCKGSRKECTNISKNFKIEYVIPQMFAEYVHHQMNLDGIKYYTVRNEHLDPSSSSMKNIVLFTNPKNRTKYDMDLLNKFNIDIIQNNN